MQTNSVETTVEDNQPSLVWHLIKGAEDAKKAIEWLFKEGYEPISIIVGSKSTPVIKISNSLNCMRFKREFGGYYYITRIGANGREYVWRAKIFNCYVQWVERGLPV